MLRLPVYTKEQRAYKEKWSLQVLAPPLWEIALNILHGIQQEHMAIMDMINEVCHGVCTSSARINKASSSPVAKDNNITIIPRQILHPITADAKMLQYMSLIMIHQPMPNPARSRSPVKDLQLGRSSQT